MNFLLDRDAAGWRRDLAGLKPPSVMRYIGAIAPTGPRAATSPGAARRDG
jgi:hypothetical protein